MHLCQFTLMNKSFFPWHLKIGWIICSSYSKVTRISRKKFITFESIIEKRRIEAEKSVIVEEKMLPVLSKHFGNVRKMFKWKTSLKKNMCIVEFEEEESSREFHRALQQKRGKRSIKVPVSKRFAQSRQSDSKTDDPTSVKLSNAYINYMTHGCSNVSEQMKYFYEVQKMTEVGWRVRFFTCHRVELSLSEVFRGSQVLPFGSFVNSFGSRYSDLDMCVKYLLSGKEKQEKDVPRKCIEDNLRAVWELLLSRLTGIENIIILPKAKVPIIKYRDAISDLECDLVLQSESNLAMSEVLYLLGATDPRVRPFVSCVRWWAKQKYLTRKKNPGQWFSSFTITLLTLFFLMNTKPIAVLPSLETLVKLSSIGKSVTYPCTRDLFHVPSSTNAQSLESLLKDFFLFYANFDFQRKAISLITGNTFQKPSCFLYLQNPIDTTLNVTSNTVTKEIKFLQKTFAEAANMLEEYHKNKNSSHFPWGFLKLCCVHPPTRDARS